MHIFLFFLEYIWCVIIGGIMGAQRDHNNANFLFVVTSNARLVFKRRVKCGFIMLLWCSYSLERRKNWIHGNNPIIAKSSTPHSLALDAYHKAIRANEIPRYGVLCVEKSAWRHLYEANNAPGLITFTGMNHCIFIKCLENIPLYFDSYFLSSDMEKSLLRVLLVDAYIKYALKTALDWLSLDYNLRGAFCTFDFWYDSI